MFYSEFAVTNGKFDCVSVKIGYALTDVAVENGSFAVIPGSHKSSYANPYHLEEPDETHPLVQTCPCQAGDAVISSEDLTHGAVRNRSGKSRRTIFASYAPAFQAAWDDQLDMAEGFETRATPVRWDCGFQSKAGQSQLGWGMEPRAKKKKQNVRPFQTGTGQRNLSEEDRYAFDIAGFLILEGLLTNDQVRESQARLEETLSSPPSQVKREQNGPEVELLNVAECGGVLEDILASDRLLKVMEELILGNQIRLVAPARFLENQES